MADRLKKLETQFKEGYVSKENYIKKMHMVHKTLWEYHEFIQDKNIKSIEILRENIKFTTRDGIAIICDPEDERSIPIEILNFGDYEASELHTIRKFLKKDSVILDIGANIGWYCLNLSKNVPRGRIMAFEPIPTTFGYLLKNIALNNITNIIPYNFGLCDKEGGFEFYYSPKLPGATSLRLTHKNIMRQKIKCKINRLDNFITKLVTHVDFIKCDVEGAELFVIRGGLETLKKWKPVLFLEMLRKWSAKFGYHPNEIIELLNEIRYACYYRKNNKLVKIKKIDEKTEATNFYFLDPDKHKKYIP